MVAAMSALLVLALLMPFRSAVVTVVRPALTSVTTAGG
jgi:hypothetical protein